MSADGRLSSCPSSVVAVAAAAAAVADDGAGLVAASPLVTRAVAVAAVDTMSAAESAVDADDRRSGHPTACA